MVSRHTVTLANSIVGVSVLAMPFCFKQCGIVLATLSLMMGAVITRMVCYFLLKAALMSRRRTYEMLAWSTFGQTGKFMVEISIIGFLIGTLIAFMVVIGDLGPEILSEMFAVENNSSLRTITMTALSLFVALPLGLLRNIDSLSSVSTASVLFYLFLVLKIFSEGIGPLWSGEYLERIDFWKSGGVLQCIPIFSMALSCQTQIFGIYDALPEPSLQKMNEIVKQAVNICTFFYFCVGFFGYIAFSQHNFGGNILLIFSPAWSTQLIKSMFLMSVVFSVPLVVFPCRASLHSMIFKSGSTYHQVHDMSTNYIPESRLKFLTVTIVGFTLVVGILIPNIELVLGLVGSTTGSVICIIFPSIMFVRVTSKNTTERLLAQGMFFIGVVMMLLTTYATLYAAEQSQMSEKIPDVRVTENLLLLKPGLRQDDVQLNSPLSKLDEGKIERMGQVEFHKKTPEKAKNKDQVSSARVEVSSQKATPNIEKASHSPSIPPKKKAFSDTVQLPPKDVKVQEAPKKSANVHTEDAVRTNNESIRKGSQVEDAAHFKNEKAALNNVGPSKDTVSIGIQPGSDLKKEFVDKQVAEAFLKKLEEHQENQKKLLEEQKEILEELKQHHAQDVREKIDKEKNVDQKSDGVAAANMQKPESGKVDTNDESKPKTEIKAASVNNDGAGLAADKITREQEKIIEKISENIEKESKNVQLLEKLEEGLNKEVQMMDAKNNAKSNEPQKAKEEQKVPQEKPAEMKVRPDQSPAMNSDSNNHPNEPVLGNTKITNEESPKSIEREKVVHFESKQNIANAEVKQTISGTSNDDLSKKSKNDPPSNIINAEKSGAIHVENHHKIAEPVSNVINKVKISEDTKNANKNSNVQPPSDRKTVSESNPRGKVDREI